MTRARRSRRRGLLCAGVLVLAAAGGAVWMGLRRSMPSYSERLAVEGIEHPLEVVRDARAVPHIFAASDVDAEFALGYVHAQDRLWQLEVQRRLGAGTLAEIFGVRGLEQDRSFRVLGLVAAAERDLEQLEPWARELLDAYARGINAFILQHSDRLPPEFTLFGVSPTPFRPVDSLVWLKVMAWSLSRNWLRELDRLRLSQRLAPEELARFFHEPLLPPAQRELYGELAPAARALALALPPAPPVTVGSNAWVVDGRHTRSGLPLLANDPHLELSAPPLWYLAHLSAPDSEVHGATMPGLPGVIIGRNQHVAWGFANAGFDVQDLYIEHVDPKDMARYLSPSGSQPFIARREVIAVKGAEPEILDVRSTRHGPVISDVDPEARALLPAGSVLALRWTALEPGDRSVQFPLRAARVRSAKELQAAARDFHAPPQTILYADDAGAIGFVAAGRVPLRPAGDPTRGRAPVPGWLDRHDWRGWIPFDELPHVEQPESGRIVAANQDITPPGYPHWLASEWAAPHRAQRIAARLDATAGHDRASFQGIQLDVQSGVAVALLPRLLELRAGDPGWHSLRELLRTWNREMSPERPEPLIFAAWLRELGRAVCADELGEDFAALWNDTPEFLRLELGPGQESPWCDDRSTPYAESCAEISERALRAALEYLNETFGRDPTRWTWGQAHQALSSHTPLSELPLIGAWFDVRVASGGDNSTVNVGGYFAAEQPPFTGYYGAGLRAVYDLARPDGSALVLATGQAGHPWSPHYRDQSQRWASGEPGVLHLEREQLAREEIGISQLTPR